MTLDTTYADPILTVDLGAIRHNWEVIAAHAKGAKCGAVVKANGYGLGVEKVAPTLYDAGCREFMVATLDEGIELRGILADDAHIAILNGIRQGQEPVFAEHRLTPIINTREEGDLWCAYAVEQDTKLTAILHVDTGMNRLGVSYEDAKAIADECGTDTYAVKWRYIMSHLACSDVPDEAMNERQKNALLDVAALFPGAPVTFANSTAGLGESDYHFNLVRPGIHLYGSRRPFGGEFQIRDVATLTVPVIQLRDITEPGTVGYGATYEVGPGDRIAVLPIGYADGYLRSLSNHGRVAFNGQILNLAGRVSMDLMAVDVTECPDIEVGSHIEIIGPNVTIDDVAERAGTIAYEILTGLSARYKRIYK